MDISNEVEKHKDFFRTKDEIAPGKNVTFRAKWKNNRMWYFEGHIGDDSRTIHITAIGSIR